MTRLLAFKIFYILKFVIKVLFHFFLKYKKFKIDLLIKKYIYMQKNYINYIF